MNILTQVVALKTPRRDNLRNTGEKKLVITSCYEKFGSTILVGRGSRYAPKGWHLAKESSVSAEQFQFDLVISTI